MAHEDVPFTGMLRGASGVVSNRGIKRAIRAALCCGGFVCATALAQNGGDAGAERPDTPPAVDDEIIVLGRSPAEIRAQIKAAEQAVYDRFNDINSDDEFDIHCRQEAHTGSRILRRVCQPNFWRDAQAKAGEETTRALQGSFAGNPAMFLGEALQKGKLMVAEMRELALKDIEFQRALVRLGTLEQALQKTGPRRASSEMVLTADALGEGTLPYGAALQAEVRVGHRPWRHALTQHTFAFAHVSGEVTGLDVKCRGHDETLTYDVGAEWTLPADWGHCDLRVEAQNGTTFSFYEFE